LRKLAALGLKFHFFAPRNQELKIKIQIAREEGNAAATKALDSFTDAADLNPGGQVIDRSGTACLVLNKPSSAFRNAAQAIGLIGDDAFGEGRLPGEYPVMEFQVPFGHPAYDSITGRKPFVSRLVGLWKDIFLTSRGLCCLKPKIDP
jgi:hypothetical protein